MAPSDRDLLQRALRDKVEPSAIVVAVVITDPDEGVVAWVRDDDYEPLITHRWGRHRDMTDGGPLFFSGVYTNNAREWIEDFEQRGGPWPR